ncbi:MAG: hypothetical protein L3J79_12970, partial [Candidatus Marinimicrobia bacterium]|nr:hypothetical protein [Candidatus Neomarinimicrobiota bacterium]
AKFQLDVKLAGYSFEVRSLDPSYSGIVPGDQLLIVASPVCRLIVDVRLPDGTPASSAELKGKDGWTAKWSSKAPSVKIKPGYHLLHAQIGDAYSSELQTIHLSSQRPNPSIIIQMNSKPKISIKIIGPSTRDGFSCLVYWLAADPGIKPSETELLRLGQPKKVYIWDSQSKSVVTPALTSGRYWVGVGFVPWRIEHMQSVDLDQGVEHLEFNLDHIPLDLCFQLQVMGSSGEGLDDISLDIEDSSGTHISNHQISQGDGQYFLFPDFDPGIIVNGENGEKYFLRVHAPSLGSKLVPLDSWKTYINFAASAELQVEVLGRVEEGSYSVRLQPMSGDSIWGQWQEGGYFLIKAEAGPYQVKLLKSSRVIVAEEVVLSSATQRIQLSMPVVFSLHVEYLGDKDQLSLFSPFGEGRFNVVQDVINGRAEFTELVPGKYFILAEHEQMAVEVVDNTRVQFVAKPVNALGVSILFPKGHETGIHESGFRNGDLIVGLDKRFFSSREDMKTRFEAVGSLGNMVFMVERAGEAFELIIERALMKKFGREQDYFRIFPTSR